VKITEKKESQLSLRSFVIRYIPSSFPEQGTNDRPFFTSQSYPQPII